MVRRFIRFYWRAVEHMSQSASERGWSADELDGDNRLLAMGLNPLRSADGPQIRYKTTKLYLRSQSASERGWSADDNSATTNSDAGVSIRFGARMVRRSVAVRATLLMAWSQSASERGWSADAGLTMLTSTWPCLNPLRSADGPQIVGQPRLKSAGRVSIRFGARMVRRFFRSYHAWPELCLNPLRSADGPQM